MVILTIMEMSEIPEPERGYWEKLARIWLHNVSKSDCDKIVVMYHTELPTCVQESPVVHRLRLDKVEKYQVGPQFDFLLRVKLLSMLNYPAPYIWLDWDAIPLVSLQGIWPLVKEGRTIGVGHQKHVFTDQFMEPLGFDHSRYLNSGLLIVGKQPFCDFDALLSVRADLIASKACDLLCANYDDFLLSCLWHKTGYDFRHPLLDQRWHIWGRAIEWRYHGAGRWQAVTTDPSGNFISDIKLVHYYGNSSKPWKTGDKFFDHYENTISKS